MHKKQNSGCQFRGLITVWLNKSFVFWHPGNPTRAYASKLWAIVQSGRISVISFFLLGIIAPLVYADVPTPIETFKTIWEWISSIFTFEWALSHSDDTFGAFMRLVIWIILFTVLYAVGAGKLGPSSNAKLFRTNRQAGIVAGLLAVIGVIFIPLNVLIAIAETYSSVAAFIFLAIPCGGLVYMIYASGNWNWTRNNPRVRAVFNLALILLLWVIIHIVTTAVEGGL